MENTAILGLPLIQSGQAQKHVTHNEAIRRLDALVQPVVADMDRAEPPADPVEGARHVVGAGASGEWAGQAGRIAVREGAAWTFIAPAPGWRVHVRALGGDATFDGMGWAVGTQSAATLGINTAADEVNRLVVRAAATLLTHEGAGHQLKVNKAATAETASLLFQSNFSGRAEMGCAGEDAFSVKVSADGAAWTLALRLDAATGAATGAAVQRDADDLAPGRLARTDWTYGMGNALMPVAMLGGRPAGGLIERGATASGRFVRLADGTLVCHHAVRLDRVDGDTLSGTWACPAAFADGAPDVVTTAVDHPSAVAGMSSPLRGLGAITHELLAGSTMTLRLHRCHAAPTFVAGDTLVLRVSATGRWA